MINWRTITLSLCIASKSVSNSFETFNNKYAIERITSHAQLGRITLQSFKQVPRVLCKVSNVVLMWFKSCALHGAAAIEGSYLSRTHRCPSVKRICHWQIGTICFLVCRQNFFMNWTNLKIEQKREKSFASDSVYTLRWSIRYTSTCSRLDWSNFIFSVSSFAVCVLKMSSAKDAFDKWLTNKLKQLNTDESVFGSYISGILEGDETTDEKREALEGILSAIIVRALMCVHL